MNFTDIYQKKSRWWNIK